MKTFKELLLEAKLSPQDAMELLGLESDFDADELKKAYKRASIKNHPDKGGTAEDMQNINAAYAVLQSMGSKSGDQYGEKKTYQQAKKEWEERAKEFMEFVQSEYDKHFDIDKYTKFLSDAVGQELIYSTKITDGGGINCHILSQWKSADKKIVFSLNLSFRDERSNKGLSDKSNDMAIGEVSYSTENLINRKKVKMKQSAYQFGAKTKNIFKDPNVTFPAAKIKKSLGDLLKPVKRADYVLTFKNELGAKFSGNEFNLPLEAIDSKGKNAYLKMERSTWMRKGTYNVRAVFSNIGLVIEQGYEFKGFFESAKPEFLNSVIDGYQKIQKIKDMDKMIKELKKLNKELSKIALEESAEPEQTFKEYLND